MENAGSVIRRLRLARGLTQKALCKGICAVSYLSKIENGTANPGEEIIHLLLAALGVDYQLDETFLRNTRQALSAFFEHVASMENAGPERAQLLSVREQALQSPLADAYTLFLVYEALDARQWDEAKGQLAACTCMQGEMEEQALFFYALARGLTDDGLAEQAAWYRKAMQLGPYSIAPFFMAECLHHYGKYQEAINYAQQAYERAAAEGNAKLLLYSANLTAICYSDLYQEDLMLKYFQQTRRLAQSIKPLMIADIDYNIGATFVSMRKSAEALPYLRSAERGKYKSSVLLCHKLAIAYLDTGDTSTAKRYLRKADTLLKAGKGTPMEEKLINIVRFRLEKDYLKSDAYYRLLREVYDGIGKLYHHGFKQFHGNLLIEACVHNRRYKEALQIAAEVDVFPEFIE